MLLEKNQVVVTCLLHPGKGMAEKTQDTTVVVSVRVMLLEKTQDTTVVVSDSHVTDWCL